MKMNKLHIIAVAFFIAAFVCSSQKAQSQTSIYSQTFNSTPLLTLPSGWTDSTGFGDWFVDDGTNMPTFTSCGVAGSSGGSGLVMYDGNSGREAMTFTLSTSGRTGLTISWNENRSTATASPALSLDYSTDGTTFTNVSFTDVTADGSWHSTGNINLPVGAENQAVLYIKISCTQDGAANSVFFDDFVVMASSTSYYYSGSGAIENLSSWSSNSNGIGGFNPTSFQKAGQSFYIQNTAAVSVTGAWTLDSLNGLYVGDGTNPTNLTIANTATLTLLHGSKLTVQNSGTLTLQNASTPSFTALAGSTVDYGNGSNSTMTPTTYYNLTISNGTKNFTGANTVSGALTINAGCIGKVSGAPTNIINLNGTIAGTGAIQGGGSSSILIGGTGAFGTITFANTLTIGSFKINRTGGGFSVKLGSALTVTSAFNHATSGDLDLNGNKLTVSGTSTLAGSSAITITGSSASSLSFSGTISSGTLYMSQTSASTRALSNLTLNKATTLTLGNEVDIYDSICPTLGTISAGAGNLYLIADQSTVGKAGRIGRVGGSLTGTINSQVYHAPNTNNTDWRLLGVAGTSGTPFSTWANTFPMVCPTCPITTAGGSPFSSITTWDEPTSTYPDITYGSNIAVGTGYWVYMGSSSPGSSSSAYLITTSGTPVTGNVNVSLTSSGSGSYKGYNLIANPYASPVSWAKLRVTNPSASLLNGWYTYSPAYGDNAAYVGGISTPAYSHGGQGIDDVIPAGMGFYVSTTSALSFGFTETCKVNGNNEVLLKGAQPGTMASSIQFFRMQMSGPNMMNEAIMRFENAGTPGFDSEYDLYDQPPGVAGILQISTLSNGQAYTINTLSNFTQNYSVPVLITCSTTGSYQFNTADLQNIPAGVCLILHDNYTGADHDLRSGPFNLTINDTETVARFVLNITANPLSITTNAVASACANNNTGYITAVGTNAGPWNYTWKDGSGNIIRTSLNKASADTLSALSGGTYVVEVSTVGMCDNATQTFTLTAPLAPSSAFSSSANTVNTGVNVTFTNNSANTDAWFWTFGDGNTSSVQDPVNAYAAPGIYTVTLYAINSACADTATSTDVITVLGTTGIQTAGKGEIIASKDANGAYVKFDYAGVTNVDLSVYNAMGQLLLHKENLKVSTDKIYLDLDNGKGQFLILTIRETEKNNQVVKRIFNE